MQKTWCVAKPSTDQASLLANLDFACSHVDCRILKGGCPCSSPDNLMNHASIAMNLYYQAKGRNQWNCDFRCSGLIVMTNPSKSHFSSHKLKYQQKVISSREIKYDYPYMIP